MIDLQPTVCNLCGGTVEYIKNSKIYGKSYGSGFCYHCINCDAYVGTHKDRPREAMGILANEEMRRWKNWCHNIFDKLWQPHYKVNYSNLTTKMVVPKMKRGQAYSLLAKEMGIPKSDCHFGYFNVKQLKRAYAILKNKFFKGKDESQNARLFRVEE